MPTAILQTFQRGQNGNKTIVNTTKTITHNNARLYTEGGATYEYIDTDASGNRIYRDSKSR